MPFPTRGHDGTVRSVGPADEASTERSDSGDADANSPRYWGLRWLFPDPTRKPVVFGPRRYRFGRAACCEVVLAGGKASRIHAEVYRQGVLWVLSDRQSTNGTWIDGQRVQHAPLKRGQVVRLGEHLALVDELEADSPQAEVVEVAPHLIGGDVLQRAVAPALGVAPSRLPIVIAGATGTGKERVARAVHELSGRAGPFLGINCAALPEHLAESELFGVRKGAFTGAERDRVGYLRAAHGGTLFLDELTELPLGVQAKVLRTLQEGEVVPLGDTKALPVDVRVIAACREPLATAVEAGRFREDLYMRLAGIEVQLPCLSDRIVDLPALFTMFVRRAARGEPVGMDVKLLESLCTFAWPGNVRQLEMVAERLVALRKGAALCCADLPWYQAPADGAGSVQRSRTEYEIDKLKQQLVQTGGNVARAAANTGISRQRAYRLLNGKSAAEVVTEQQRLAPDSRPTTNGSPSH